MAQEINEVGTIDVTMKKNVIFNKRYIKNITFFEGEKCNINFSNVSEHGELTQTVAIDNEIFSEMIESVLWQAIDKQKGESVSDGNNISNNIIDDRT